MKAPADPLITGDSDVFDSRALVVEVNLTNQRIIAAILQSLDFDVRFATNGAKAVEALRIERFDMDIHMPVMDGFEATKEIRDLGGWCASVPIIGVAENEMAKDSAHLRHRGFQ